MDEKNGPTDVGDGIPQPPKPDQPAEGGEDVVEEALRNAGLDEEADE